jgi:hypothetical protein
VSCSDPDGDPLLLSVVGGSFLEAKMLNDTMGVLFLKSTIPQEVVFFEELIRCEDNTSQMMQQVFEFQVHRPPVLTLNSFGMLLEPDNHNYENSFKTDNQIMVNLIVT